MTEPERIDLQAEYDRLVDEAEDVAERVAGLNPSTDMAQQLTERGRRLDTHRRGVEWAMDEWDVDEIAFKPLTLGDDARLSDHFPGGESPGSRRNYEIALGTTDAPYLEHDPGDVSQSALEETVENVGDIPSLAFGRWAQARIDELSAVGNWSSEDSFAALLTEARASNQTPE